LPSITYAVGFVKAYARTVGADEVGLAKSLRAELGHDGESRHLHEDDDIADPARVPPRWLAWAAAIVVVLIAGVYGIWRSGALEGGPAVATTEAPKPANSITIAAPQAKPVAGPVVLTAQDDVWFRIYDKNDKVLFEGVKKKGEAYPVPADADTPMIRTGRADQIAVTVGGQSVPALGPAEATVKDVVLTGAALIARPAPSGAPSTATTATPPSGAAGRP
jgi:cytoskeleton protein RodZ